MIRVVPGKDANTVERFAVDFMDHNGDPNRVTPVTRDMSPGFAKGIRERPPDAARVIDEFHVVKHAHGAVDQVRQTQAARHPLLRRTTYPRQRNEEGLTGLQLETQAVFCQVVVGRCGVCWRPFERLVLGHVGVGWSYLSGCVFSIA